MFCSFIVSYNDPDDPFLIHEWTCDYSDWTVDADNPKIGGYSYFRVTDYPEVVPNSAFAITFEYRFSDNDEWREGTFEYVPVDSCVFILDGTTDENGTPNIAETLYYDPKSDSTNYSTQQRFLPRYNSNVAQAMGYYDGWFNPYITKLIQGWFEDGQQVGPFYAITEGRHVVSPGEVVDLPDYYTARLTPFYFNTSLQIDSANGQLGMLQTLTGAAQGSAAYQHEILGLFGKTTLEVPYGFEAIDLESDVDADTLSIPASVLYVNTATEHLAVHSAYQVDANNPVYSATEEGILTNKEGTVYHGIPLDTAELTVPESVTQVDFTQGNKLQRITLEAPDAASMPQLDFANLGACTIVVANEAFESFAASNYYALNDSDITIAKASDPATPYHVSHGMIYSDTDLVMVMDTDETSLTVTVPHTFKPNAFNNNGSVSTVLLGSSDAYALEDNCFANSKVNLIVCNTEEQLAYVSSRLEAAGAPNATAVLMEGNGEGYRWYTTATDTGETTTLIEAPASITSFEGVVARSDGSSFVPSTIAANAFANCNSLQWVTLEEGTTRIGASAFANCTALEGVLIKETGSITVENYAFSCPNLRFLASMAMGAYFATTDTDPSECRACCLAGATGYPSSFLTFEEADAPSAITGYEMVEAGGSRILYGTGSLGYVDGPWFVIAAGSELSGDVALPETTVEVFSGAFSNVSAPFTINWDSLPDLEYIDGEGYIFNSEEGFYFFIPGAFAYSGIREVSLNANWHYQLDDGAFAGCRSLTSVTAGDYTYPEFGEYVFSNCSALTSVVMGNGSIHSGAFPGCDSLQEITFTSAMPPDAMMYERTKFSLTGYGPDADAESLKLNVPEGNEENVIRKWVYPYCGFDTYEAMYNATYFNLLGELGRIPSSGEVKVAMADDLLVAENQLRQMMGIEQVESSSLLDVQVVNGCTFIQENGETVLVDIPADLTEANLDKLIPDSFGRVTIGADAFSQAKDLKRVVIGSKVSGFHANAFAKCAASVEVVLPDSAYMPELIERADFVFGSSDITFTVPAASQNEYLKRWTWQLRGFEDENEIVWGAYGDVMWGASSYESINEATNTPFLDVENNLRTLMGLPTVTKLEDMASYLDVAARIAEIDPSFASGNEQPEQGEQQSQQNGPDELATVSDDDTPSTDNDGSDPQNSTECVDSKPDFNEEIDPEQA